MRKVLAIMVLGVLAWLIAPALLHALMPVLGTLTSWLVVAVLVAPLVLSSTFRSVVSWTLKAVLVVLGALLLLGGHASDNDLMLADMLDD